jgi:CRISPR-associated protein Cas5t
VRALRIVAEGLATSFRYPHFLVGRQPSFHMPPPATIYGHACSALGEWIEPSGLRFGYVFRFDGIGDDLELLHMAEAAHGRLPGTTIPRNLDVTTAPLPREVLLNPHLVLYLDAADSVLDRLQHAFREPRYVVTLGRSQDLMAYRSVDLVELEESEGAYLEGTLLPWHFRLRTRSGTGATMAQFIDPRDRRRVVWSPYIVLEDRVLVERASSPRRGHLLSDGPNERWWVDPETPAVHGVRRAVIWHSFVDAVASP